MQDKIIVKHLLDNMNPDVHSDSNDAEQLENKPFLLLVEDNLIALKAIQYLAQQSHCSYLWADNGEKALDLAKTNSFDLIITDLGLPDFSGLELTQKIRAWEKGANKNPVPIIGLSVHAMNEAAMTAGMNELLIKPMNLNDLQRLILDYLYP